MSVHTCLFTPACSHLSVHTCLFTPAHFIDAQTRSVALTIGISSNYVGVRSRANLLFETVSTGSVLPSYDMET